MIYQHPLAYLIGMEGRALLRAWAGDYDYDQRFVEARIAEVRRLLEDEMLTSSPGVLVERGATYATYRQWSASYDEPGNGLFDIDEPIIDEILDTLPVGHAVDAACGTGRVAARLVEPGHRVVGIDSSPEMLRRARRRLPDTEFVEGDVHRLPLRDDAVDLVVTALALTHVPDLEPVFAEFARVLRPGGHVVISDVHDQLVLLGSAAKAVGPSGEAQMAFTHRHTVADYLRAALANHLRVRRFEEEPRPGPPGPAPEPTHEIGTWPDWPWTLLGLVPEATEAAWNDRAIIVGICNSTDVRGTQLQVVRKISVAFCRFAITGQSQAAQTQPLSPADNMMRDERIAINRAEQGDTARPRITVGATSRTVRG